MNATQLANLKRWWQPRYTILLIMWLVYGCFYLNRLALGPVIPLIIEDLNFSHTQVGLISSFLFAFYAVAQFPAGYLSDVFGSKRIITFGGLASALANYFFSAGSSLLYLIGCQSLNGIGQGGGYGPIVKLLNNWFPKEERGRALGIHTTCVSIFTLFAYVLAGYFGKTFGWRSVFWVAPSILLPVLFISRIIVDDKPANKIRNDFKYKPEEPTAKPFDITKRLKAILSNRNMVLACFGYFCLMYITYCNLIWLPSFFYESYGLSIFTTVSLAGIYPLIGLMARPLGGFLSDVPLHGRRKPLLLVGFFSIMIATFFLANTVRLEYALVLIVIVAFFDQLIQSLFFALELDMLTSELTGTGAGFLEAGGHFGSMSAMLFTGLLVDLFGTYKAVFLSLSFLAATGFVVAIFIREDKA